MRQWTPTTPLYEQNLSDLRGRRLKDLHPSLYACVKDPDLKDSFIELARLNEHNQRRLPQREQFAEVVRDEELVRMLAG